MTGSVVYKARMGSGKCSFTNNTLQFNYPNASLLLFYSMFTSASTAMLILSCVLGFAGAAPYQPLSSTETSVGSV